MLYLLINENLFHNRKIRINSAAQQCLKKSRLFLSALPRGQMFHSILSEDENNQWKELSSPVPLYKREETSFPKLLAKFSLHPIVQIMSRDIPFSQSLAN